MRNSLFALCLLVGACGAPPVSLQAPKSEGIRSTIDVQPKNPPGLGGGYEFDLLDAVEGASCLSPSDENVNTATIPGFTPTDLGYLEQRAEGAALFDAMNKAQGADTLLVTWVKIISDGEKKCATVHARGVRLRQSTPGTPVTPSTPPEAPPAPSAPPSAATGTPTPTK
jgi:hypothetical protein